MTRLASITAAVASGSSVAAATAVLAALDLASGDYNVVDDEPVTRRDYFAVVAALLEVPPPKPLPGWTLPLMGSVGELLARSLRISNRKLREAVGFRPKYASVRQGWPAVIGEMRRSGRLPGSHATAKAA